MASAAVETGDVLKRILAVKREEITERSERVPLRALAERCQSAPPVRSLEEAVRDHVDRGLPAVIAEIKKASPSKGVLREDFDVEAIARSYARARACGLSVLTDVRFFQGDDRYLALARETAAIPVLRKDFVIDAYQVYEARSLGADCILLIVAALGDASLAELAGLARHLGMDALIEVHDATELDRAMPIAGPGILLGINNRNLRTFETTLDTTVSLLERIEGGRMVVTESGIHTRADVARMREAGVHAFLVGEAFMRAEDPGARLEALFGPF